MRMMKRLLAGVAVVVATAAMSQVTSQAAPMPTHLAAIKAAASSDTVQVRWGGGWHGGGGWRGGGGWGHGGWAHGGWGHRGYGYRPGWGAVAAGALIGGGLLRIVSRL
jgi:hypothetical protein